MSPAEVSFLERAVVQLLLVSARTFSLDGLRDKLRELFLAHPEPTVRAAASVGGFELVQILLKASGRLEKLGLMLDVRGGTVRLTTCPVEPPALRDYFALLRGESRGEAGAADGQEDDGADAGPLGEGALEVLACVAFKQPVGQWEINAYFGGTDGAPSCAACSTWAWWTAAVAGSRASAAPARAGSPPRSSCAASVSAA